ncbi:nucleotidyltransferase domain-containing protein [Geofilum rubicundum]
MLTLSAQTPGFVTAYLFGSYAKNIHQTESDIDIALVSPISPLNLPQQIQ